MALAMARVMSTVAGLWFCQMRPPMAPPVKLPMNWALL